MWSTGAKLGDLVMDERDWDSFRSQIGNGWQLLPEEDPPGAGRGDPGRASEIRGGDRIDVMHALRKAHDRVLSHPSRKKTARGMRRSMSDETIPTVDREHVPAEKRTCPKCGARTVSNYNFEDRRFGTSMRRVRSWMCRACWANGAVCYMVPHVDVVA